MSPLQSHLTQIASLIGWREADAIARLAGLERQDGAPARVPPLFDSLLAVWERELTGWRWERSRGTWRALASQAHDDDGTTVRIIPDTGDPVVDFALLTQRALEARR